MAVQDQHPNTARGFSADTLYDFSDIDSVNLFSGNLTLQVPIGPKLAVNGVLPYQLTLTYNSNCWDYIYGTSPDGATTLQAMPTRRENAGLGWLVSYGRVFGGNMYSGPPPSTAKLGIYESPDGADHAFYSTLHFGDTNADTTHAYTRDGTYLRAEYSSTTWTIEFPDGTKKFFQLLDTSTWQPAPPPSGDVTSMNGIEFRLMSTTDPFGNTVSISYSSTADYTEIWTVTGQGATPINVYFKTSAQLGMTDTFADRLLDHVDVPRVGGGVATYSFHYTDLETQRVPNDNVTPGTMVIPYMDLMTLPTLEHFGFGYDTTSMTTPGTLTSMALPTGGTVEWTWMESAFPDQSWGKKTHDPVPVPVSVAQRQFGGGTWTYGQRTSEGAETCSVSFDGTYTCQTGNCFQGARQKTSWVTAPDGTTTVSYFSTYRQGSDAIMQSDMCPYASDGWTSGEYGLPFTRYCPTSSTCAVSSIGSSGKTFYLSSEVRTGFSDSALGSWDGRGRAPKTTSAEQVLRSKWLTYAIDSPTDARTFTQENPRVAANATLFDEAPLCFATCYSTTGVPYSGAIFDGFDGFGHFKQASSFSSFANGVFRTRFTNYDSALDSNGDWVLGTSTEQCTLDEPTLRTTLLTACSNAPDMSAAKFSMVETKFDRARGLMLAHRTIANRAAGPTSSADLLTVYGYDTYGNRTSEQDYGGDKTPLSTTDDFTPTTAPAYEIDYHNAMSQSALTSITANYAGTTFNTTDLTFDAGTGLTTSSRDTAGLETDYHYDGANRLTDVQPAADAWMHVLYTSASGSTPASVEIKQTANGTDSSSTALTDRRVYFDPWGRVSMAKTRMPDGVSQQWSTVQTGYDGMGRVASQAMPEYRAVPDYEAFTPAHVTTTSYDALGRQTSVTSADGSSVTTGYPNGVQVINRTVSISTPSGDAPATTSETYDDKGRLIVVSEPSGGASALVRTTYGYDVGDRLVSASTAAAEGTQLRTFSYDGRGFLTAETHPELGAGGYGSITYSGYDARGHVGEKRTGTASDLHFTYDAAERLTSVTNPATLESFTYGTSGLSNGKLVSATRQNIDPVLGMVPVTESYTYGGLGGRVDSRTTTIGSTAALDGASFTYSQTWDPLGGIASTTYPGATGSTAPGRTVTNSYAYGLLTAIGGYASMTYAANGMLATLTHGSGPSAVMETWGADQYAMARPSSITATNGSSTLWSSGTYLYDGSGNIKQIGTTTYAYDEVGRLAKLTDMNSGVRTGYTYDSFGNSLLTATSICRPGGAQRCFSSQTTPFTTVGTTNHFSILAYDDAGNVTRDGTHNYVYDGRNMLIELTGPQTEDHYLYTADDERVAIVHRVGGRNRTQWTIRNTANQLLRTFTDDETSGTRVFTWTDDVIWRGAAQVARESAAGTTNQSVDHLGSLRAVSNAATGSLTSTVTFAPWGTGGVTGAGATQFTGYERDTHGTTGDYLDYAHARYYNPGWGRFLSVDRGSPTLQFAQSWNRYVYVVNNPLGYIDPTGRDVWGPAFRFGELFVALETSELVNVTTAPPPPLEPQPIPWWDNRGLAEFLQTSANLSAGFADTITFNATMKIRKAQRTEQFVNPCSGAYLGGQIAGVVWSVAAGGEAANAAYGIDSAAAELGNITVSTSQYESTLSGLSEAEKLSALGGKGSAFLQAVKNISNPAMWSTYAMTTAKTGPTLGGGAGLLAGTATTTTAAYSTGTNCF